MHCCEATAEGARNTRGAPSALHIHACSRTLSLQKGGIRQFPLQPWKRAYPAPATVLERLHSSKQSIHIVEGEVTAADGLGPTRSL